jgi:hypothetical protein
MQPRNNRFNYSESFRLNLFVGRVAMSGPDSTMGAEAHGQAADAAHDAGFGARCCSSFGAIVTRRCGFKCPRHEHYYMRGPLHVSECSLCFTQVVL